MLCYHTISVIIYCRSKQNCCHLRSCCMLEEGLVPYTVLHIYIHIINSYTIHTCARLYCRSWSPAFRAAGAPIRSSAYSPLPHPAGQPYYIYTMYERTYITYPIVYVIPTSTPYLYCVLFILVCTPYMHTS